MAEADPESPTSLDFGPRFFKARADYATMRALNAYDEDPADASEAVKLGTAIGQPAEVIYPNLELHKQEFKSRLTSEILDNNEHLRNYVLSHPLGVAVSRDDWGPMDTWSRALSKMNLGQAGQDIKNFGSILNAVIGGYVEGSDFEGPPGGWLAGFGVKPLKVPTPEEEEALKKEPKREPSPLEALAPIAAVAGIPIEGIFKILSGVIHGAGAGVTEGYRQITGKDNSELSDDIERALADPGTQATIAPFLHTGANAALLHEIRKALIHTQAGEVPRPGASSLVDEAHKFQARLDADNAKELAKAAHDTETSETPESIHAAARAHVGDYEIGISAKTLERLYPEGEAPTAGDGRLGDLKEVRDGFEAAMRMDHDINITVADWHAFVPKEVKTEIADGIRWRPRGMTLEEAKEPVSAAAPPPEDYRPSNLAAVREANGVTPKGWDKAEGGVEVLPSEPGIVPEKTIAGEPIGTTAIKSTHAFPVSEGLKQINKDRLTGSAKVLDDFFGDRLSKLVGDVPVKLLSQADIGEYMAARGAPHLRDAPAVYTWPEHEILIREDYARGSMGHDYAAHILMHEAAHALTLHAMDEHPHLKTFTREVMDEVDAHLTKRRPDLRSQLNYAFKDEREFLAESMGWPGFRDVLSVTPLSKELSARLGLAKERGNTVWDAVRRIVRDLLERTLRRKVPPTALDAVLQLGKQFEAIEVRRRVEQLADDAAHREFIDSIQAGGPPPGEPIPEVRMEDRPLFVQAAKIGLSKERMAKWMKLYEKWVKEDGEFEKQQALKDERKRQSQEWKSVYKETRKEVEDRLSGRPDFAADKYLREGGDIGGQHVRRQGLDSKKIPEEFKGKIPADQLSKGGLDPAQVAAIFGFETDKDMLNHLARMEQERQVGGLTPKAHFAAAVDAEADRLTREKLGPEHADILKDIEAHVYSPTQIDMMSEWLVQLAENAKAQLPITGEKAVAYIKDWFRKQETGKLDTKTFQAEVARAEKRFSDAVLDGNVAEQFKAYSQKYMLMIAANQAVKFDKFRGVGDRLIDKLKARVQRGVPEEFTNALHLLMVRGGIPFGLGGINRLPEDLAERLRAHNFPDIPTFINYLSEDKRIQLQIPEELYNNTWADGSAIKSQGKMTVSQYEDWIGLIKSIYNIGKEENSIILGHIKMASDDWIRKAQKQVFEAWGERPRDMRHEAEKSTLFDVLPGRAKTVLYKLVWMQSVWKKLDLYDRYGMMTRTFTYPLAAAANQWSAWYKELVEPYRKLAETHPADPRPLPNLFKNQYGEDFPMRGDVLRQAMLYAGTESGLERLVRGWMVRHLPKVEDVDIQNAKARFERYVHDNATKEDWDYVAQIWKSNDEIFKKWERMMTGMGVVPMQKVPLKPWTDKFGRSYEGGYQRLIAEMEEQQKKGGAYVGFDPDDAMGTAGVYAANTARGYEHERSYEKARTPGYAGPLYLYTDRNAAAMGNVLRDAAMRPALVNTAKLWNREDFKETLRRSGHGVVVDMLKPYLDSVAGMGERMSRSDAHAARFLDWLTSNTVARLIGWSFSVAGKHGISAAINSWIQSSMDVGLQRGLSNLVYEWGALEDKGDMGMYDIGPDGQPKPNKNMTNREFMWKHSLEIQRRIRSVGEQMGVQMEDIGGYRSTAKKVDDWFKDKGSVIVGYFDLKSAEPTWADAFKRSMREQSERFGDVDIGLAIEVADSELREAHGSTAVTTRPEALRGGAVGRSFTRLFGFWNTIGQRVFEASGRTQYADRLMSKGEHEEWLTQWNKIGKLMFTAAIMPGAVHWMLSSYPGEDKDPVPLRIAKNMAMGWTAIVPGLGEVVRSALSSEQPHLGMFDAAMYPIVDAAHDLKLGSKMFDAEHGGKSIRHLFQLAAQLRGWGNDEVAKVAETIHDVLRPSSKSPKTTYEVGHELITGKARNK